MVGLGRMGASMVERPIPGGHCLVTDDRSGEVADAGRRGSCSIRVGDTIVQ
jgi:6-phosphogluconate dehydrogenase (decarboxylating)